jgi:predicted enzyme related to lactoylglutathione lyase
MTAIESYPAGTFCWVDLATTDARSAADFYTRLFGWDTVDLPAGDAGTYTMLAKGGKNVCALFGMNPELCEQGIPAHWQSYISVEDAGASCARLAELGGEVVQPAFDVSDVGRMAVVRDPAGAAFALWQPGTHTGAGLVNEPGTLCWNELHTPRAEEAIAFYGALFGWTARPSQESTAGVPYVEFMRGERRAAGLIEIRPEWGEVPPNWAVYFAVADCGATLTGAESLGGRIAMPPTEVPGVGRFAFVRDPQGAFFAIIQLVPASV